MKIVGGAKLGVIVQGTWKMICALTLTLFLLSTEEVHALIVDSLFFETSSDFTWRFTWNGVAGPVAFSIDSVNPAVPKSVFWGAPPTVPIPDPTAPNGFREQAIGGAAGPVGGFINPVALQGGNVQAGNDLFLATQHKQGPHIGVDVDPGTRAVFRVSNADFAAPAGPGFLQIGGAVSVAHMPHFDEYALRYRSVGGGGTEFEFTGHHVVPEPTTLLLWGTAMAGVGLALWRRRRQN